MRSEVSLDCWDTGSVPGSAQWVKGSGVAAATAEISSCPWPGNYICCSMAQHVKNPNSIHEHAGSIPGIAQWVRDLVLPQASM